MTSITYPLSVFQQMTFSFQDEYGLYLFLAALVFGFILSFAVGANDSANSWGRKDIIVTIVDYHV